MGLFRSEPMRHGTFVLPHDRARYFLDILGRRANIQFVDMNATSMKRPYKGQIQRIDDLERILRVLGEQISKYDVVLETGHIDDFLKHDHNYSLDKVEEALNQLYVYFVRFDNNNKKMLRARSLAIEEQHVMLVANAVFSVGGRTDLRAVAIGDSANAAQNQYVGFSTIAGVIRRSEKAMFSNILFRITRGNCFSRFEPVMETLFDEKGESYSAFVFWVYFQGGEESPMGQKIRRTADAFGGNCYAWPNNAQEAWDRAQALTHQIKDNRATAEGFASYFVGEIQTLVRPVRAGGNSLLEEWRLFCLKEKSLYTTLNMFEGEDLAKRASGWFPAHEEEFIAELLSRESQSIHCSAFLLVDRHIDGFMPETHGEPLDENQMATIAPTYFDSCDVMKPFQLLVNSYGTPRYMEVNPAVFATIFFPFLFGIMFGDVGHASYLVLFSIYLFYLNRSPESVHAAKQGLFGGFLPMRYMVLFSSLFSIYCGLLYNDFMAVGMDLFGGSHFKPSAAADAPWVKVDDYMPYPFGVDPAWKGAHNEIAFTNSLKMKLSIVVGIVHMTIGIILRGFNNIFFQKPLDLWLETIPQFLFMMSLFGYMVFLIFFKWIYGTVDSPMIINTFLNMVMSPTDKIADIDRLFEHQETIQQILLAIALICVPIMMFGKTIFFLIFESKSSSSSSSNQTHQPLLQESNRPTQLNDTDVMSPLHDEHAHEEHEEHEVSVGMIFMHSALECIEFCLGSVSNTASYLRLWALSLAHSQLALVFFNQLIGNVAQGFGDNYVVNSIKLALIFAMFMIATTAIIILMDSLECFLHALRLQWVEFQNKFYKADGIKFTPFTHQRILAEEDE